MRFIKRASVGEDGAGPSDDGKDELLMEEIGFEVTNGEKVLFPRDGYSKEDLVRYYSKIAPVMLPHLRGRPVSMVRYPDGIDGKSFFQKDASSFFPAWLPRVVVAKKGGTVEHVLCEKVADLAYLANLACITPHIWLSRVDLPELPDRMIIDLDPSGPDFMQVIDAALLLREELERVGLAPFVMTTGSRGMHVVAPLDRSSSFEEVRAFARRLTARIMKGREDELTLETSKDQRRGRLLLDTFRNSYGQTGVAPYAVRAKDGAPVATPLSWREVEKGEVGPTTFNIRNIFNRLKESGDPWRDIDTRAAPVPGDIDSR